MTWASALAASCSPTSTGRRRTPWRMSEPLRTPISRYGRPEGPPQRPGRSPGDHQGVLRRVQRSTSSRPRALPGPSVGRRQHRQQDRPAARHSHLSPADHRAAARSTWPLRATGTRRHDQPRGYSGCYHPRLIEELPYLSRHSWGTALDLNIVSDERARDVQFAPELVDAMSKCLSGMSPEACPGNCLRAVRCWVESGEHHGD